MEYKTTFKRKKIMSERDKDHGKRSPNKSLKKKKKLV